MKTLLQKKKPTHKMHIWFLPTHKTNIKKPKVHFLANATTQIVVKNVNLGLIKKTENN